MVVGFIRIIAYSVLCLNMDKSQIAIKQTFPLRWKRYYHIACPFSKSATSENLHLKNYMFS